MAKRKARHKKSASFSEQITLATAIAGLVKLVLEIAKTLF